jgi:CBS domain-containing protein
MTARTVAKEHGMKVENILNAKGRDVETISPEASIVVAIHRLTAAGIGALVVSSDGNTVKGILFEGDIVRALSRHGAQALELRVADCMTRPVSVCSPDALIQDAMAEMTRRRQRHLPVVSHGKLCGLLSVGDVVKYRLDELELETNVLRDAYICLH